jgi:hypothetical protein
MESQEHSDNERLVAKSLADDPIWCAISNSVDCLIAQLKPVAAKWNKERDGGNFTPVSDEQRVPAEGDSSKEVVVKFDMGRGCFDVEETMTYSPNNELVLNVEQWKDKLYEYFTNNPDISLTDGGQATLPFNSKDDLLIEERVVVFTYNADQVCLQVTVG